LPSLFSASRPGRNSFPSFVFIPLQPTGPYPLAIKYYHKNKYLYRTLAVISWVVKFAPQLSIRQRMQILSEHRESKDLGPLPNSRRFTLLSNFLPQTLSFHTLLFSIFFRPFLFNRLGTAVRGVGGPAACGAGRPHTCHPERSEGSAFFRSLRNSPSQGAPSSPASSFRRNPVTSLLHLLRGSLCLNPLSTSLPIPAAPI
jgi:hypothetical protein